LKLKCRRVCVIKTAKVVFALVFLAGCVSLIGIGSVELARFAVAKPASDEGWIAFARDGSIWIMQADEGSERLLTKARDSGPVWSPDGRQITFMRWFEDPGVWEVYVMNADGTNPKKLTRIGKRYFGPVWSPDGTKIAFGAWEEDKQETNVWVMNGDGSNAREITSGCWPSWIASLYAIEPAGRLRTTWGEVKGE
jgi:Tol biopolymer transport system component